MRKLSPNSAELIIYSEIDGSGFFGISDRDVIDALSALDDTVTELGVRINSGGGDVFAGIGIYEALRRFPGNVTTYVDGLAASIASVIALAGTKREISRAGMLMIHPASGGVYGQSDDMRSMADVLDKITERIASVYQDRTGMSEQDALEMMRAKGGDGTWFDAEEAIEFGFMTSMSDGQYHPSQEFIAERLRNAQQAFGASLAQNAIKFQAERLKPNVQDTIKQKEIKMDRKHQLQERLETATLKAEKIKTDSDGRDFTAEELGAINELHAEMKNIQAQITALDVVANATQTLLTPQPRQGEDEGTAERATMQNQNRVLGTVASKRKDGGFTNGLGEFALAVQQHYAGGQSDERLFRNVETNFGTGGVGTDGGFAIPEDFRTQILSNAIDQDPLISRVRQIPTASRLVSLPTHEAQPWDAESLQSYWTGEGSALTRSKLEINQVTISLNKIAVFSIVTEELLEDAPALESVVADEATRKINFALSNAIVRGSGTNMPLGFLNAPSLATVTKESAGGAQTADTIKLENVYKMYTAMPPANRTNAVWLVHPDAEHQLYLGDFHQTGDPIGYAPGTLQNSPFGVLLGRPVIPHEVCETLGDLGDIMFVDLSQYAMPVKQGGLRAQSSMHLAFDQDLMAFKFTIRVGGAPLWKAPISSRDGSFSRSPFVVLESR